VVPVVEVPACPLPPLPIVELVVELLVVLPLVPPLPGPDGLPSSPEQAAYTVPKETKTRPSQRAVLRSMAIVDSSPPLRRTCDQLSHAALCRGGL
jgi:hypothetical protein